MASPSFQLVMRAGPNPGKIFDLKHGEMTIGRDVGNHIVINDPEVSRKHAQLVAQVGGYTIEDLGSTNGSFVNGQRLTGPHLLRHGDVLMLGENVSLVYEAMQYDPDATVLSSSGVPANQPRETFLVPPEPAQTVPDPYAAQPQPAYVGQVPPGPPEPYMAAEPAYEIPYEPPTPQKKSNKTLLFVGIGCVVILLCVCVAGGLAFDTMNLYCEPPFNALFSCP